jgi:hypothetical protein
MVPRIILTVNDLDNIARFERYMGVTPDYKTGSISIIFRVKYKDGSGGYVYGGSSISGKPSSETQFRDLKRKVGSAKALLKTEEWNHIKQKYGVKKENILFLSDSFSID